MGLAGMFFAAPTVAHASTCQATGYSAAASGPHYIFGGNTVDITNLALGALTPCLSTAPGSQPLSVTLSGDISLNASVPIPFSSPGSLLTVVVGPGVTVGPTTTYSNEIVGLSSPPLPFGATIRESPTLASDGQTTVTDLGGGNFQISSFFDVFTELSLDGGQTWVPSAGPTLLVSGTPLPATLPLFVGGLGVIGLLTKCRKRKAIAA